MTMQINTINVNVRGEKCAECGGRAGPSMVTIWPDAKPVRFCPECALEVAVRLVEKAELCVTTGG